MQNKHWWWDIIAERLQIKLRRMGKLPYEKNSIYYNWIAYDAGVFKYHGIAQMDKQSSISVTHRELYVSREDGIKLVWPELDENERKNFMSFVLGNNVKP